MEQLFSGQVIQWSPSLGGLRPPKPPCLAGGLRPPDPPHQRSYGGSKPPGIAGSPGGAAPRFCRGSGGRSPPVLQGVWGAQPPSFAGGFGGPPGPPILTKIFLYCFLILAFFFENNYLLFGGKMSNLARFGPNNYLFFVFGGPPTNQW